MTELHVISDERTTIWRVYQSDVPEPLSQHTDATEAELAAQAWARRRGADRIFIHDRYHCTHEPSRSLGARTRTGAAREPASPS